MACLAKPVACSAVWKCDGRGPRGVVDIRPGSATIQQWASTGERWKLSARPRLTLRPRREARGRHSSVRGCGAPDHRLERAPSPANALTVHADDRRRVGEPASFLIARPAAPRGTLICALSIATAMQRSQASFLRCPAARAGQQAHNLSEWRQNQHCRRDADRAQATSARRLGHRRCPPSPAHETNRRDC
jgi:hypothetical protein